MVTRSPTERAVRLTKPARFTLSKPAEGDDLRWSNGRFTGVKVLSRSRDLVEFVPAGPWQFELIGRKGENAYVLAVESISLAPGQELNLRFGREPR
jgi:hypothetical protein